MTWVYQKPRYRFPFFTFSFCFVSNSNWFSESAKMDSKPTSWPRSRMESHLTKRSREKRKLQSSSPSSRNHPAQSIRRMKRFQKSTAIYTLPIGKQLNGTLGTGKSNNILFKLHKSNRKNQKHFMNLRSIWRTNLGHFFNLWKRQFAIKATPLAYCLLLSKKPRE